MVINKTMFNNKLKRRVEMLEELVDVLIEELEYQDVEICDCCGEPIE